MMWSNPLILDLYPTDLSESFRDMEAHQTGIPILSHPGAFSVQRKHHRHEGVDLYCGEGSTVRAVETGIVVAVIPFTGMIAGSPWWRNTWAVLIEGASGVVVYGEINSHVSVGADICRGDVIGQVVQVLTKDKGRPMSMLHLELHVRGTRDVYEWRVDGDRPASLLDPTPHLLDIADRQNSWVR